MYEIFEQLLQKRGVTPYKVSKTTGVSQSTLSDWKSGKITPTTKTLQKIADYFEVTIDYLLTGNINKDTTLICPHCGLTYDSTNINDIKYHVEFHTAWEKATEKFGELYCNFAENEKIKAQNRNICNDLSRSLEERYNAAITVFKCLFSRSVESNNFDLNHVPFNQYIAMMLNNKNYRNHLDNELYQKLIADYGTMTGIKNGTSYFKPNKQNNTQNIKENDIINYFVKLNNLGKQKAYDYVIDLSEQEKYTKSDTIASIVKEPVPDYLAVQAAHNDSEIDDEELGKMQRDIEWLKKHRK